MSLTKIKIPVVTCFSLYPSCKAFLHVQGQFLCVDGGENSSGMTASAREQQRLFFQSCSGSTPTLSFSSLVLVQGLSALAAWSPSCCVSVLWAQAGTGNGHCCDRACLTTAFPDRNVISSGQVQRFMSSYKVYLKNIPTKVAADATNSLQLNIVCVQGWHTAVSSHSQAPARDLQDQQSRGWAVPLCTGQPIEGASSQSSSTGPSQLPFTALASHPQRLFFPPWMDMQ